ncbi:MULTISPECIES: fluoride efflux transporter CrcB [Bacillaceae]|uniref:fluoride efflux transporter CrcB n=1 Tax=Bacillaceae TaxID=186817 RepID=UPI000C345AEF|nr:MULTISPECIES: fluoride efflux transporter CrcB [Bacillaceae]MCT4476678.1 fluoride efflux transporter CrcB [Peribacillus frigoritolerans]PKF87220.1 fluoride efflux transporter CrcB [Bacillus sp. BA3]CAH0264006.1 Putative fluoride ion transporter CrcB [Peribacillus sp. Bi134]
MIEFLSVFIGGFFGAASRYVLQIIFNRLLPAVSIPISILLINLLGSFGLGLVFPQKESWALSLQVFLTIGFLGAFTTFSTFSMETLELIRKHRYIDSLIYITVSVLGCIGTFLCGYLSMV